LLLFFIKNLEKSFIIDLYMTIIVGLAPGLFRSANMAPGLLEQQNIAKMFKKDVINSP
jgi:hypothetical protein